MAEQGILPSVIYPCSRTATGAAEGPRTSRFVDVTTGGVAFLQTDAALAWDDTYLYVHASLEERDVWTTDAERSGLVWQENTLELLIAADGAQYHLSVNAAGRTEELLFVWHDALQRGGRYDGPDLDPVTQSPMVVGGDSGPHHRRGRRFMYDNWQLQGLQVDVSVDGTLNERLQLDRGWDVRLALPWDGLRHVRNSAGDDVGPPAQGEQLRVAVARNQVIDQRQSRHTAVWSWHTAGAAGLHAPESWPVVELR